MSASVRANTRIALRGEALSLDDAEIGRLLGALAELDLAGAEAVADQIAALRLAGGEIRLTPTEAEIAALELALAALAAETLLGPGSSRLPYTRARSICKAPPV